MHFTSLVYPSYRMTNLLDFMLDIKPSVAQTYKKILSILFLSFFYIINKLPKGNFATSLALEKIWNLKYEYKLDSKSLFFHTPNWLSEYRARTLISKEPETILWINTFPPNSVLYDVGANVGIYSIYAASIKEARVISIEPSFLNLELLFRNIQANNLQNKVTIVPLSLSLNNQVANFYMQSGDNIWGGSHNTSGKGLAQDGNLMRDFLISSQVELSMDSLIEIFGLPNPEYLKLDVDGLESEILKGATKSLKTVKSILVEVNQKNNEQGKEIHKILEDMDFTQLESIGSVYLLENQIWVKNARGK